MADSIIKILNALKTLNLNNAGVIVILLFTAAPVYVTWKLINDRDLMSIVFSTAIELPMPLAECSVAAASFAGELENIYVRDTYRERGREAWYVGVRLRDRPDEQTAKEYCKALEAIIAYARDPATAPRPLFPASTTPIFEPR